MKLRTRMLVMVLSSVLICFVVLVGTTATLSKSMMSKAAFKEAELIADRSANAIASDLLSAYELNKNLVSATYSMIKSGNADRDAFHAYYKQVLEENELVNAVWCLFEPDTFDGKDEQYKADTSKYDHTGRFQSWWSLQDGSTEPVYQVDDAEAPSDVYDIPKSTLKPLISEPYDEEGMLMTSIVIPVMDGTRFLGVVGVDMLLEDIQAIVSQIKPYDTGYATLLSDSAKYVAANDKALLGMDYAGPQQAKDAILSGQVLSYTADNNQIVLIPVPIGDSGVAWSLEVRMPLASALADATRLQTIILVLALMVLAAMVVVVILVANSITRPIEQLSAMSKEIAAGHTHGLELRTKRKDEIGALFAAFGQVGETVAGIVDHSLTISGSIEQGNLSARVDETSYSGDFRRIVQGLNTTIAIIDQLVASVKGSAVEVAGSAAMISSTSQSLAQGAAEQAAAVEEISSSIVNASQMTDENAQAAGSANTFTAKINEDAADCSEKMGALTKAVEGIASSSNDISKIIKTIEDIAFQTNILALNAAVEAARAGQHGKGFAVVADEVRNLATKSAEAAGTTNTIIAQALDKTSEGTDIARQTSQTLERIVQGIGQTTAVVERIAHSSNEQAIAIDQIKQGIELVSSVVAATTAVAEESAAASMEMSSQAERLSGKVARFRNSGEQPALRETGMRI